MYIRRTLFVLLIFCVVAVLISGIALCLKHIQIANICRLIKAEQSTEAIEQIMHVPDINEYSAPLWLRPIFLATGTDVDLPLVIACKEGDLQVVEALLAKGADPNKFLDGNWSPIEATFIDPNIDRFAIAELLIKHGAKVDLNGSGDTALFNQLQSLMYSKDFSTDQLITTKQSIALLLQNGASTVDSKGNTIMHYLCYASDIVFICPIIDKYGYLLDQPNQQGQTPLMWAIQGENVEVVKHFVNLPVNMYATDVCGKTILDYAYASKNQDIVDVIIGKDGGNGDGSGVPAQGDD